MTTTQPLTRVVEPAPAARLADRIPRWALLALGFVATVAIGPRYGIAAVAWLAPVPFLMYTRSATGWRAWLALAGTLVVAYPLQLVQICTPPVPWFASILFGAPMALTALVVLGVTEAIRRRAGDALAIYAYAAATVVGGWAAAGAFQLGQWAMVSNTQVHSDALMQLASVFGVAGLDFVMGWFAAVVAVIIAGAEPVRSWRHATLAAVAIVGVLAYGSYRLDTDNVRGHVTVGAVVTDVGLTPAGVPSAEALAANEQTLFDRTDRAAALGARLVVWNEVATMVDPSDEARLLARGQAAARRLGIDLVLAYGVLESRSPLRFGNKYAFITDDGAIAQRYTKHHPVPGEPSTPGTEPIEVVQRPYGRVAGALCYDYDFASLGLAHARAGADLVVVPSSDWRGIDPVHTDMARVRGIEGGYSVVRSTRWGTSAAFDAYGRVRGWMDYTDANDRVMVTTVPVGQIATLRAAIGDLPIAAAGAFLGLAAIVAVRRRRAAPR